MEHEHEEKELVAVVLSKGAASSSAGRSPTDDLRHSTHLIEEASTPATANERSRAGCNRPRPRPPDADDGRSDVLGA